MSGDLTFTCRSHAPPLHSEAFGGWQRKDAEGVWKHRRAIDAMARDDLDVWSVGDLGGQIIGWVREHADCDVAITDDAGGVYELPSGVTKAREL